MRLNHEGSKVVEKPAPVRTAPAAAAPAAKGAAEETKEQKPVQNS